VAHNLEEKEKAMNPKEEKRRSIFRPEGTEHLEGEQLDDDQRALLLALVSVDTERGDGDAGDAAALETLADQIEGYDAEELQAAIHHLVNAKAQEERKLDWPELRRRKDRSSS
jgi:hypothetical protein